VSRGQRGGIPTVVNLSFLDRGQINKIIIISGPICCILGPGDGTLPFVVTFSAFEWQNKDDYMNYI
jgi:hypothetical protein